LLDQRIKGRNTVLDSDPGSCLCPKNLPEVDFGTDDLEETYRAKVNFYLSREMGISTVEIYRDLELGRSAMAKVKPKVEWDN